MARSLLVPAALLALLTAPFVSLGTAPALDAGPVPAAFTAEHAPAPVSPVPVASGVVGSRNSDVYHSPNCRHARRINPSNLVRYPSAAAAQAHGRRACKVCSPR